MRAKSDKVGIYVTLSERNIRELAAMVEQAKCARESGRNPGTPYLTKLQAEDMRIVTVSVEPDATHYR